MIDLLENAGALWSPLADMLLLRLAQQNSRYGLQI
jgi:hypothetical protein